MNEFMIEIFFEIGDDLFVGQLVCVVECDGVCYILLGIVYVLCVSVEVVEKVIDSGCFDVVVVELDLQCLQVLSDFDMFVKFDLVEVICKGCVVLFVVNLVLFVYQCCLVE